MTRCSKVHPKYGQCKLEKGHDGNHIPEIAEHTCHARGCFKACKPEMLMCYSHWKMVPKKLQLAVYKTYRNGQCTDKNPSAEWIKAANAAINAVYEKEIKKENE